MSEHVIEFSAVLVIEPTESGPPQLWPLDEMFDLPGVTLIDAGFRILNPSPEEIN